MIMLCDCDDDDDYAASLAWVGNSTCAKWMKTFSHNLHISKKDFT